MLHAGLLFVSLALIAGQPKAQTESWVVHGRVLDAQGHPVADVGISTFWGANGVTHEEIVRYEKERGDGAKLSANEGRMEPWGDNPANHDAGWQR